MEEHMDVRPSLNPDIEGRDLIITFSGAGTAWTGFVDVVLYDW
jgi:hypothetical protein